VKIFVVNCGSSSIKYRLFDMTDESTAAEGVLERVGSDQAQLRHRMGTKKIEQTVDAPDHATGLKIILKSLISGDTAVLERIDQIDGVGHRVVHGAEDATGSARIDDELLAVIRRNAKLAPLHNPPNLSGIEAAMAAVPGAPHVAVFDTAFLSTLPPRAYRYAVPEDWFRNHHVRKYGFHGTSHRFVTLRAAELLGRPADQVCLITLHLGNGCSMTAVADGRAIDHSMGMTPLEGLMMGTRSGDLDPAILPYMVGRGMSLDEVDRALNKSSGLLGLSGLSNDMRDLLAAEKDGNAGAALAIEMFVYRIVKSIGAYHAILPRLDAVVLTGGIGENSVPVRARICRGLERLGVVLDEARNARAVGNQAGRITGDESRVGVWVIPTNEELMIARDTAAVVGSAAAKANIQKN